MRKDTCRSIEITAVLLTVVAKLVYDICKEPKPIIVSAIIGSVAIFWVVYLFIRICKEEGICKEWGFTKTNFKPAMKWAGIVGVAFISACIIYGHVRHTTQFNVNILKAVPLYIIWGIIQQLVFISLFAGNLDDLQKPKINNWLIVFITSVLFSALHTSRCELMIVTFFMGIFCTFIFLKYRNLYPLGIFHGVTGTIFYYFYFNEDPWAEMMVEICSKICS